MTVEQPLLDRFKALGGDPEVLRPAVAVAPEYLEAALDEMYKTFGSIEGYFSEGLGLDEAAQQSLRSAFVEGA
ncbi:MAG: tyrosine-protein phosphatase [Actinomycetes bacterium]